MRRPCAGAEKGKRGWGGGRMAAGGEWVLDHTLYTDVETHPPIPDINTEKYKKSTSWVLVCCGHSFNKYLLDPSSAWSPGRRDAKMNDTWVTGVSIT